MATKKTKKTEVAVKEKTEVAVPVNAANDYDSNVGMEDIILPRVELLQALSPSVVDDGMKPGTLVNNITKEDLGNPVKIVPLYLTKNWIRWKPRAEGGGIMWRSNDPKDERVINETKWGADGTKPLATAYLNFLCLVEGQDMPLILSFCNTSYKAGRKLLTLTKMVPGHIYNCQYDLTTSHRQNNLGSFYVFEVTKAGPSTSEQRENAAQVQAMFAGKDLNFESEGSQQTEDTEDEF